MIGIFGSAFNPPTKGHACVIKGALSVFDRVIAVPSYDHCFGKIMAPFKVRVAMASALIDDINSDKVTLSEIEAIIWNGSPVSSLSVLRALSLLYPNEKIHLIIGPDNADSFDKFKHHDIITRDFGVYVAPDAGGELPRSTEVRRRITRSEPFFDAVTPSVAKLLIKTHYHFQGI